ncbi:unnamed protein product [Closterium sp. NIES-65]|nr:unnamed protein product [Closterium sp. NIES-65]
MVPSALQSLLARPASRSQVRDFDDASAEASKAVQRQATSASASEPSHPPRVVASYEGDGLIWNCPLAPHPTGEVSMALADGNVVCEDFSRVDVGSFGTLVGVFDGHGGPHAARFAADSLLGHVHRALGTGPFQEAEEQSRGASVGGRSVHDGNGSTHGGGGMCGGEGGGEGEGEGGGEGGGEGEGEGEGEGNLPRPGGDASAAEVIPRPGDASGVVSASEHGVAAVQREAAREEAPAAAPPPAATLAPGLVAGEGAEGAAGGTTKATCASPTPDSADRITTNDEQQRACSAVLSAFASTEADLLALVRAAWQHRPELANTGTCALVAFFPAHGASLVVASLGDSRAVLGRRRPRVGGLLESAQSAFGGMGMGLGWGADAGGSGGKGKGWRSKGRFLSWGGGATHSQRSSSSNSCSGGGGSVGGGSGGKSRLVRIDSAASDSSRASSGSWSSSSRGESMNGDLVGAAGGDGAGGAMGFLGRWIGGVAAVSLSEEHNASQERERQRLQQSHPGDPTVVMHRNGAWRVKGIIQVTRSLGDFYLKHKEFQQPPLPRRFRLDHLGSPSGVALRRPLLRSDPSVVQVRIGEEDRFVILASDGLWEHMSRAEAVKMVDSRPRQGIAHYLARTAVLRAARKVGLTLLELRLLDPVHRRKVYDDITVVVVFMDKHCHAAAGAAADAGTVAAKGAVGADLAVAERLGRGESAAADAAAAAAAAAVSLPNGGDAVEMGEVGSAGGSERPASVSSSKSSSSESSSDGIEISGVDSVKLSSSSSSASSAVSPGSLSPRSPDSHPLASVSVEPSSAAVLSAPAVPLPPSPPKAGVTRGGASVVEVMARGSTAVLSIRGCWQ